VGFVWRCLKGLGLGPGALEDAAQEVFIIVHRRLPEFRGDSTVRTWLYSIVRNVASNHQRQLRRRAEVATPEAELPCPGSGPEGQLQTQQAAEFVQEHLRRLDEQKRELFILGLLEGLSGPELADALDLPLNNVYTSLRRLRLGFELALTQRGERL